jgi:hypothetical protein
MSTLPKAGVKSDFRRFEELNDKVDKVDTALTAFKLSSTIQLGNQLGNLQDLETIATNLVGAVNELLTQINERSQYGVVTGLVTTAQDEPDMSVNVSSGTIYMANGDRFEVVADTMALIEADADNPRIDIIYINGIGLVSYYPGTAAAAPEAPETPSGSQLLAQIAVGALVTKIEAANITDKRKIITN